MPSSKWGSCRRTVHSQETRNLRHSWSANPQRESRSSSECSFYQHRKHRLGRCGDALQHGLAFQRVHLYRLRRRQRICRLGQWRRAPTSWLPHRVGVAVLLLLTSQRPPSCGRCALLHHEDRRRHRRLRLHQVQRPRPLTQHDGLRRCGVRRQHGVRPLSHEHHQLLGRLRRCSRRPPLATRP